MRQEARIWNNIDRPLLLTIFALMAIGFSTVYSATYNPNSVSFFDFSQKYMKQFMWVCVSLFLGFVVFLIDSDIFKKFSLGIYGSCFFLLIIVLFMPAINGAHAWLGVAGFGIQPAEFMKTATAIVLSNYLSKINVKLQDIRTVFVCLSILLVPMVMILLQPDAGTFVVFTSFFFVLYREGITFDPLVLYLTNLIPGVRFKETWVGAHFIPILFYVVFLSVVTLIMSSNDYEFYLLPGWVFPGFLLVIFSLIGLAVVAYFVLSWISSRREKKRILIIILTGLFLSTILSSGVNFFFESLASHQRTRIQLVLGISEEDEKDGEDYNRNRAMAAVGSAGLLGKGFTKASVANTRTNHVPEAETDFIFCNFAEEWGFLGTTVVLGLYLFMLFRIVLIAERQRSRFNRVYAYCVCMILFYHFAINIGMNIGLAPVIGIPFPFFSFGGSSMMSFSIMLFILLKLDSQRRDALF
jgi:rod shape determining protein RodA